MARAFAEADLRPVLPHIDIPTLLLYGDADRRSPLAVAEELHAEIHQSTLVVLPDVGHQSNLEAAERFNAEVRSSFNPCRCEPRVGPAAPNCPFTVRADALLPCEICGNDGRATRDACSSSRLLHKGVPENAQHARGSARQRS